MAERAQKQFAVVFDINKCIACQTCTLACKTTWTSGKGQEYMLWNNVESKPYGFYPLAWDVNLLEKLGVQPWTGESTRATLFEAAAAGERVLGWRPDDLDYANPNVGEDDCAGRDPQGRLQAAAHALVLLPGAHLQSLHLPGVPGVVSARFDLQAARRRYRAHRSGPLPRLPGMRQGVPVQEGLLQSDDRHLGEVHRLLSRDEKGLQTAVLRELHRQDPHAGLDLDAGQAREDNPIDYLVHVRKVALPLFPQFGLEPNVYYIPPVHVPRAFLRQMFGADVREAIETYRPASDDPKLGRPAAVRRARPGSSIATRSRTALRSAMTSRAMR